MIPGLEQKKYKVGFEHVLPENEEVPNSMCHHFKRTQEGLSLDKSAKMLVPKMITKVINYIKFYVKLRSGRSWTEGEGRKKEQRDCERDRE